HTIIGVYVYYKYIGGNELKSTRMFFIMMLSFVLLLAACGKGNDNDNNNNTSNNDENVENNEENNNENNEENNEENDEEENEEENTAASSGDLDFAAMFDDVEELTDGETSVLYEETEAEVHEEDDYSVSLDGYAVAELKDVHMDFSIPLGDSDEGAVLITHHT